MVTIIIDNKEFITQIYKILLKEPLNYLMNEYYMYCSIKSLITKLQMSKVQITTRWKPSHTNILFLPQWINSQVDTLDKVGNEYQTFSSISKSHLQYETIYSTNLYSQTDHLFQFLFRSRKINQLTSNG